MSTTLRAAVTVPSGRHATPVTILQAVSETLGEIEKKAAHEGVKPVWDKIELSTEVQIIDDRSFADLALGYGPRRFSTLQVEVLAVDPDEVDA